MKATRMHARASALFMAAATWMSAAAGEFAVLPWHGSNAVLAQEDAPFGARPRATVLSGTATNVDTLVCSFSTESKTWLDLEPVAGQNRVSTSIRWQLSLRRPSSASRKLLLSGQPFDATMAAKRRRADPEPILRLTNLVVGPVWALVVDPDADSHELPGLTDEAKRNVRVLVLDGGVSPGQSSGWMSAAEAEAKGLRAFCGLPRAFANAMTATNAVQIGIVLVRRAAAPPNLPTGGMISDWKPSESDENHPALLRAVSAAREANLANSTGAGARYGAAWQKHRALLTDRKRQGIIGPPFTVTHSRWEQICPGDQDSIPFRVTGLIR